MSSCTRGLLVLYDPAGGHKLSVSKAFWMLYVQTNVYFPYSASHEQKYATYVRRQTGSMCILILVSVAGLSSLTHHHSRFEKPVLNTDLTYVSTQLISVVLSIRLFDMVLTFIAVCAQWFIANDWLVITSIWSVSQIIYNQLNRQTNLFTLCECETLANGILDLSVCLVIWCRFVIPTGQWCSLLHLETI